MADWTRRTFLASSLATLACRRGPPDGPELPPGPVTLGWRWVPGMELRYRSVIEREVGERRTVRSEEWTYLVRALDTDNVATIEGRLTGLGGEDDHIDPKATAELLRLQRAQATAPCTLRVGMDGRLLQISALPFGESLCHRLLALRMPRRPVHPYDEWSDTALMRAFATLLPVELEHRVTADARLLELHHDSRTTMATIESKGVVRGPAGLAIHASGTTAWDAERGVLSRRTLEAHFLPERKGGDAPGALHMTLFLA